MTAHPWTPDEDAQIAPTLGRRITQTTVEYLAWRLGRHRAQVVPGTRLRVRRALRRLMRRGR